MDVIQSFLLGILQGLTEFLPVSSSGHLALARGFTGSELQTGILFEVVVHFGTLCSIVVYYRKKLTELARATPALLMQGGVPKNENQKLLIFILLSMIPAMIVGFSVKDKIEDIFMNPVLVSIMLLLTGCILFFTRFADTGKKEMNTKNVLILGMAQAFAMLPGISRSGSTISAGLYLGLRREEAANFSFLMVIPVIAGAMLLQVFDLMKSGASNELLLNIFVAFLAAFASGYYALKYLIIVLQKKGFHYFSFYCWLLGGGSLIYFLSVG